MPYQNNIQLDNANIDILLEPAQKVLPIKITSRTQTEGYSQAVFIDPRFIDSIDTNISVVEVGFTGGVIKAKKRSYSGQNEFGLSHRITKNSWIEFHIDEDLSTGAGEGADQRVTGTPREFHPNFDKPETPISGATRIGGLGVFASFSENRFEIIQKCTAVLESSEDLAYFLGTGTFTFIDGFQYLDLMSSDEKTGLNIYEVQDQGYVFSWNLNLLYPFETDFGAPYVRADVINVTNIGNVMRFEAGKQLFSLGGQYWAEVGYEF